MDAHGLTHHPRHSLSAFLFIAPGVAVSVAHRVWMVVVPVEGLPCRPLFGHKGLPPRAGHCRCFLPALARRLHLSGLGWRGRWRSASVARVPRRWGGRSWHWLLWSWLVWVGFRVSALQIFYLGVAAGDMALVVLAPFELLSTVHTLIEALRLVRCNQRFLHWKPTLAAPSQATLLVL